MPSDDSLLWSALAVLAPLPLATAALAYAAVGGFVAAVGDGGEPNLPLALGGWLLAVLLSPLGLALGLLLTGLLAVDVRRLRRRRGPADAGGASGDASPRTAGADGDVDDAARPDDGRWRPSYAYVLAGLAHAAGAVFPPAFAVSVPAVGYYLLRRRRTLRGAGGTVVA
jgi:hypothetical protein